MLTKKEKHTKNVVGKDLMRRVTSEVLGAEILLVSNGNVLTGIILLKEGRVHCKYG
jgi:hypothetical protein